MNRLQYGMRPFVNPYAPKDPTTVHNTRYSMHHIVIFRAYVRNYSGKSHRRVSSQTAIGCLPVVVVVRGDKTAVCECDSLHVGDGLVGVVRRAVGEEVVDEHADYGEEEDDKGPENLVWHGAVRLEDLNCSTNASATVSP